MKKGILLIWLLLSSSMLIGQTDPSGVDIRVILSDDDTSPGTCTPAPVDCEAGTACFSIQMLADQEGWTLRSYNVWVKYDSDANPIANPGNPNAIGWISDEPCITQDGADNNDEIFWAQYRVSGVNGSSPEADLVANEWKTFHTICFQFSDLNGDGSYQDDIEGMTICGGGTGYDFTLSPVTLISQTDPTGVSYNDPNAAEGCLLLNSENFTCLPIELLSFEVEKQGSRASVSWVTLTELDNDYYEVERSIDGKEFRTIGKVEGAGTDYSKNEYNFVDERPHIGINYYRLKQVDYDGKYSYSRIRSVYFEDARTAMSVYPNPSRDEVELTTGKKEGEVMLQMIDAKGQVVYEKNYLRGEWIASQRLDISDMKEGMYMIVLKEGKYSETARFVKVR